MALAGAGSTLTGPVFSHFNGQNSHLLDNVGKSSSVESGFLNESSEDETTSRINKAATKIQAGYRGMQIRKSMNKYNQEFKSSEKAATTIQAGFRGLQARNNVTQNNIQKPKSLLRDQSCDNNYLINQSATKIQAGYRGMMSRRDFINLNKRYELESNINERETEESFSEHCNENDEMFQDWRVIEKAENGEPIALKLENDEKEIIGLRESSGKVARVGAIPFEMHDNFNQDEDVDYKIVKDRSNNGYEEIMEININRVSSLIKTEEKRQIELDAPFKEYDPDTPITIYLTENDHGCEEVELYLRERHIDYVRTIISRKQKNHLSPEFLEINPEGTLPTLLYGKNTVKTDSVKINHFIEERVPSSLYQALIPCTTSTAQYQRYLYLSSKISQIDVTALEIGIQLFSPKINTQSHQIDAEDLRSEIDEMLIIKGKVLNKRGPLFC